MNDLAFAMWRSQDNMGFSEFLIRGLDGARLELNIASIAHNLKKIWIMSKVFKNKNILYFESIIYLNCDPACLRCGKQKGLFYLKN